MATLQIDRRDAGRILSALREKHRKIKKNIDRFGDDFDPELGAGILEGEREYQRIIYMIQEAVSDGEEDNPARGSGSDR